MYKNVNKVFEDFTNANQNMMEEAPFKPSVDKYLEEVKAIEEKKAKELEDMQSFIFNTDKKFIFEKRSFRQGDLSGHVEIEHDETKTYVNGNVASIEGISKVFEKCALHLEEQFEAQKDYAALSLNRAEVWRHEHLKGLEARIRESREEASAEVNEVSKLYKGATAWATVLGVLLSASLAVLIFVIGNSAN